MNADSNTPGSVDLALIIRLQGGDPDALSELYDRHAALLLAIGVKILGSRDVAEDILHDVFIEAWQRAGSYRPDRATVRTWLSLRMRSRCIDRLRATRLRQDTPGRWLDTLGPTATSTSAPIMAIDAQRAAQALIDLPNAQRQVMELAFFKGFSYADIADHLGIPLGTVKSRARAALSKLRVAMGVPS